MKYKRHMSVNIEGLLNQYQGRIIDILEDEEGNALTDEQARTHLSDLQSQGHKKLCCSSDCEGFDPFDKGCPGHPVVEKALTVKQPFASLIVSGIKDIENRSWKTNFRGRIYVHAGADKNVLKRFFTDDQLTICRQAFVSGALGEVDSGPFSAIIGEVDIIDCVSNHPSIWAEKDVWNWVLANPVKYDQPILNVKGALSFWEFDREASCPK